MWLYSNLVVLFVFCLIFCIYFIHFSILTTNDIVVCVLFISGLKIRFIQRKSISIISNVTEVCYLWFDPRWGSMVQAMAWHRTGDKPLHESMISHLTESLWGFNGFSTWHQADTNLRKIRNVSPLISDLADITGRRNKLLAITPAHPKRHRISIKRKYNPSTVC